MTFGQVWQSQKEAEVDNFLSSTIQSLLPIRDTNKECIQSDVI